MTVNWVWVNKAIETIESGLVKRLDSPNGKIKVYECGTIIRVDIKKGE